MGKTDYISKGETAMTNGNFDTAIAAFSKAIYLSKPDEADTSKLGEAYRKRAEAYCAKEEWDRAIEDCSFVLVENEKDADALATQAFAYYKKSDMGSAKKNCEELITITGNKHLSLAYDLLMTVTAYDGGKASYEEVKKRYYEAIGKGLDSLTIREKYLEACQAL